MNEKIVLEKNVMSHTRKQSSQPSNFHQNISMATNIPNIKPSTIRRRRKKTAENGKRIVEKLIWECEQLRDRRAEFGVARKID